MCNMGFYQDTETKACSACMDKCTQCTSAMDCTTCNDGYVF
jgi:hypothetical protein